MTHRNLLKIQTHWREIMRSSKLEELRREVAVLSQSYAREIDRKDALINALVADLTAGEKQYQLIVRAHLMHLDSLLGLHDERARLLEAEYERRLALLRSDFDTERQAKLALHATESTELKDIMSAMDEEYNDKKQAIETAHRNHVEELSRAHQEALAAVSSELRTEVLDLYSAFRHAMDNYNMHTENRQTQFKADKKQDKKNSEIIASNHRLIKRLQAHKEQLRSKLLTNDREFQERNKSLRDEKEAVSAHFLKLKARMNRFRDDELRRLTDLTLSSEACIKTLQSRLSVAEAVLSLAEINRKLETEEEKVLPFYKSSVDMAGAAGTAGAAARLGATSMPPELAELHEAVQSSGDERSEFDYLDNFHKRYNKVLLDKLALEHEKAKLDEENATLKLILKRYLDGISVSEEVIEQANPLVIVNGKTNFARASVGADVTIPVTDLQTLVVTQRVGR